MVKGGSSVSYISISVSDQEEEVECEREQPRAEQVAERGQVRDGEVIWVVPALPQITYHPVSNVQQQRHLQQTEGDA